MPGGFCTTSAVSPSASTPALKSIHCGLRCAMPVLVLTLAPPIGVAPTEQRAGKAVLADVVAHAEHQWRTGLGSDALLFDRL